MGKDQALVPLIVNDSASLTFQIDTGSTGNILPLQDYIRATYDFSRANVVLKDITLVMHDRSKRKVPGLARLKVELNGSKHELNHSRPHRPQSFWSAPRIETSGRRQDQTSVNHGLIVKSGNSDWLKIQSKYSAHAPIIGSGQRSRSLVLTKRIVASEDENGT